MNTKTYIEEILSKKTENYISSGFERKDTLSDLESNIWVFQMMRIMYGKENVPMMQFIDELYSKKYESNNKKRVLAK